MLTTAEINAHLDSGGAVQVTTYTRSWVYRPGAVRFEDDGKSMYLVRGRRRERVAYWTQNHPISGAPGWTFMVEVRLGRYRSVA